MVRQRRSPSSGAGCASAPETWGADARGAGGRVTATSASVMAIPPSTAAPAILAARPISIAFAEAADALASFGFGSRRARRLEHLRPPPPGASRGQIAALLRPVRDQRIARP